MVGNRSASANDVSISQPLGDAAVGRVKPIRVAVMVLALLQFAAPFFAEITGIGIPIGSPESGMDNTPLVPIGFAFGIWFPIFVGCCAYGAYQLSTSRVDEALLAEIAPHTVFAFAACTLWSIIAQSLNNWMTVPVFVAILIGLLRAIRVLEASGKLTAAARWLIRLPLGVYAGWSSVAIFANTSTVLAALRPANLRLDMTVVSVTILIGAGLTVLSIIWFVTSRFGYVGAVLWGLGGIAIANSGVKGDVAVLGTSLALAALIVAVATARSRMDSRRMNGDLAG